MCASLLNTAQKKYLFLKIFLYQKLILIISQVKLNQDIKYLFIASQDDVQIKHVKNSPKTFKLIFTTFEVVSRTGFITEKAETGLLPLDRQVQLVVSSMILIGLLLYYFITPYGLFLPLMAGLGLMNAALTGWCGMAKLLAIMPWNQ